MNRLSSREAITTAFAPSSVAIFGASSDPKKLGHVAVRFLRETAFAGAVYPVNPRGGEIQGYKVLRSLEEAPGPVDVAVLFVPAEQAVPTLEQCERAGVKVAIGITSGFAESGEAGAAFNAALGSFLAASPLRLIGPNCEGIVRPDRNLVLSFSPLVLNLKPGGVAIVSQSGAISGMLAARLARIGVGIRAIVTTGNENDITATDYFDWLADDPETTVILAYLEEIRDGARFVDALRRMRGRKRVVINKAGRSAAGQRAVTSHTGALAGDDRVIDGVLRELGAVRVGDSIAGIDAAAALSTGKVLRGRRIAIVSFAGGLGVEMTDLTELAGLAVPPFRPALQEALRAHLPFYGSARNPVDLTGAILSRPESMRNILRIVADDPDIDGIVAVVTFAQNPAFVEILAEAARGTDKPLVLCWTAGTETTPEAMKQLGALGVPIFDAPVRAMQALAGLARAGGVL
ncbi:MAG: CoA-binding protein [Alphaproteobacteria bacterium]|nr:CoA-binding protein [Alphaproteobacteria bacterium]